MPPLGPSRTSDVEDPAAQEGTGCSGSLVVSSPSSSARLERLRLRLRLERSVCGDEERTFAPA
jgi:hypothetical protein